MSDRGDRQRRKYVNDPEKTIRIARDGLAKHRARGNVIDAGKLAGSHGKATLSRQQRKYFRNLVDVAITELAERQFDAWADIMEELMRFMARVGWRRDTAIEVMQQIEDCAVQIRQDPYLGKAAREFWHMRQKRIMSLPSAVKAGIQ